MATKRMYLETKVQAWIGTEKSPYYSNAKRLPDYSCSLFQKKGDDIILEITADKSTCGKWTWYLNDLMEKKNNILSLECSQDWYVVGMFYVYKEIQEKLELKYVFKMSETKTGK